MALVSTSSTLQLLPLLLLFVATSEAATFNITNRCSYTVWPAAVPVGGGMQLDPGMSWTLDVPAGTTGGRVWARTGCSFNGKGNGSCQTGDCGGVLACKGYGQPPNTIAEFALSQFDEKDFFDISLVDGFNVPMDFLPVPAQGQGGQGCSRGPRCASNVTSQCPSKLQAPGGCNNACTVFKQDKYCCTGNSCEPTTYAVFFVRMCPDAYSYAQDAPEKTTFTCPSGTNYQVVFCPPIDLTSSPPSRGGSWAVPCRHGPSSSCFVPFCARAYSAQSSYRAVPCRPASPPARPKHGPKPTVPAFVPCQPKPSPK